MKRRKWFLFLLSSLVLIFMAVSALAYEILLDIDIDKDPSTINISTEDTSAVVKIVLWPTTPGETVGCVPSDLTPTATRTAQSTTLPP